MALALALALALAAGVLAVAATPAAAHPLGNFTINHYAGIRVSPAAVALDVVVDFAEIPAFQERSRIDADGDGTVDAAEQEAERLAACPRLADSLRLTIGGAGAVLSPVAAGVSFPAGTGGLPTFRVVCQFEAAVLPPLTGPVSIRFEDRSYAERIGWREIVVAGDGVTISGPALPVVTASARLTEYPTDLLASPLDVRVAEFTAAPGGPTLAPFVAPDATRLPGAEPVPSPTPTPSSSGGVAASGAALPVPQASAAPSARPSPSATAAPVPGAVPGGIQDEIAGLLEVRDLTPLAILGSMLVAFALGALHAVSPGHGKTVMAAYLVGSRGSVRHAVALGLTVTVSHTVGVLALALTTLAASNIIPPERLYPILGLASGALVIGIGLWLLYGRLRVFRIEREHRRAHEAAHAAAHAREAAHAAAHAEGHAHEHDEHDEHEHDAAADDGLEHSHGPFRHRHVPLRGETLTWRSLFTLGLAGGLVPSASALLLLLGSISANRPAYGIVLVFAFGLGMAVILGGLGIVLVHASRLLEGARPGGSWQRLWTWMPTATALVVVGAGVYITSQALQTAF